jgi:hypothetical protein
MMNNPLGREAERMRCVLAAKAGASPNNSPHIIDMPAVAATT